MEADARKSGELVRVDLVQTIVPGITLMAADGGGVVASGVIKRTLDAMREASSAPPNTPAGRKGHLPPPVAPPGEAGGPPSPLAVVSGDDDSPRCSSTSAISTLRRSSVRSWY
ncbi:unnamed protein product, partial [Iphiclides podalirius]